MCANQGKWALGLASGWKGRESAAKLALAVALTADQPQQAQKLARSYPEFATVLRKQGMAVSGGGGAGAAFGGGGKKAKAWAQGADAGMGMGSPMAGAPSVHWLTLTQESVITTQGFPAEAPAILHTKERKEYFSNAHSLLQELVPDLSEVAFEDDPEWTIMPEVSAALTEAGAEENCYCVATCPSQGVWAVGMASGWKGRESAGKLALALALAQAAGRIEELGAQYPDFAELCVGAGLMQPTKKRRMGGGLGGF